jgi:hypothetical protein
MMMMKMMTTMIRARNAQHGINPKLSASQLRLHIASVQLQELPKNKNKNGSTCAHNAAQCAANNQRNIIESDSLSITTIIMNKSCWGPSQRRGNSQKLAQRAGSSIEFNDLRNYN